MGVMRTVADLQKLMIDLCRYKVAIGDNNRFYQTLLVELKELKRKETEHLKELQPEATH
ncbi:MAG: hypothetical protein LUE93_02255 [Bacteroides sp.]|nr:hypothetical protein [Bacteroides sp.]